MTFTQSLIQSAWNISVAITLFAYCIYLLASYVMIIATEGNKWICLHAVFATLTIIFVAAFGTYLTSNHININNFYQFKHFMFP